MNSSWKTLVFNLILFVLLGVVIVKGIIYINERIGRLYALGALIVLVAVGLGCVFVVGTKVSRDIDQIIKEEVDD